MPTEIHFLKRGGRKLLEWIGLGGAEGKLRAHAENWLELADKVWAFRRDVLPERDAAELRSRTEELRQRYKSRADTAQLKQSLEALEPVLKRTGGALYPKSALVENVEFLLVAAIVIIGVRTYFVQPFKIPTNSMWPSYFGMTPDLYPNRTDEPGPLAVAARTVVFGAWPHRLDAPGDGEILIPIGGTRGYVHNQVVPGRSWLIFPTKLKEYTLFVDERPIKVRVPLDFDFDWVIGATFFPSDKPYSQTELGQQLQTLIANGQTVVRTIDGERLHCVRTGRKVRAGDRILAFDEVTGDQLFVDRLSYHFVRPKVGQGFVFFTGNIPGIASVMGEQYYIKRLVGEPGDTLQIKPPILWRNNQPISGAPAFAKNAQLSDGYLGYVHIDVSRGAQYLLTNQDTLTVPKDSYFAMGDNSNNSFDGRYWGFVPAKEVVGRPLFIYFPFSKRWGPSR